MEIIKPHDKLINEQLIILRHIFYTLDMEDVIIAFEKQTPLICHINAERSPEILYLEDKCIFGTACLYKNDPLSCSKNHLNIAPFIKKNSFIPNKLCKYERPWKNIKCTNIYCWRSHLRGRIEFIEEYKLINKINES